jgi:hypothetical protein
MPILAEVFVVNDGQELLEVLDEFLREHSDITIVAVAQSESQEDTLQGIVREKEITFTLLYKNN